MFASWCASGPRRVGNKQLIGIIWALALLPDPSKALTTPAATDGRARAVAGSGAAIPDTHEQA